MKWFNNLKMFLWMSLMTGIVYPLIITIVAQLTMSDKANGDFIKLQDKIVGARLIAQKFESDKYFWPRPSSIDYNPLSSGGSNLGSTSIELRKIVEARQATILKAHKGTETSQIPSELLFASGSGLDPHISPDTARFQVDRIIEARGLDKAIGKDILKQLINMKIQKRHFGFIEEPCVNVLELNLALDVVE